MSRNRSCWAVIPRSVVTLVETADRINSIVDDLTLDFFPFS